MMNSYAVLTELRVKLALIAGVKTCAIGLEAGLSPDDYPIIRLVPTRFQPVERERMKMELTIYYGLPVTESDGGLAPLYQQLLTLEAAIKDAVKYGNGYLVNFIDTITDEDRLDHYKLFASRFEVVA